MKRYFGLAVLFILPLVLAACGGSLEAKDAETALRAYFAGNRTEANEFFCPTRRLNTTNARTLRDANIEVNTLTCNKNSDSQITCNYTLTSNEETLEDTATLRIQNKKLCSPVTMPVFGPSQPDDAEEVAPAATQEATPES